MQDNISFLKPDQRKYIKYHLVLAQSESLASLNLQHLVGMLEHKQQSQEQTVRVNEEEQEPAMQHRESHASNGQQEESNNYGDDFEDEEQVRQSKDKQLNQEDYREDFEQEDNSNYQSVQKQQQSTHE